MERRQTWIAAAAVIATVILSAIGATWVIGRNIADMATREDVTELRNEIRAARASADAQMQELRGYIVQHLEQHSRDGE